MPNKLQFYTQMADHTAKQITGSFGEWTAFLETMGRLRACKWNLRKSSKRKKEAYAELKKVRDELRDLTVHTANYKESIAIIFLLNLVK